MSLTNIFSSIADKAQNAINQTPLAGHVHGTPSSGGHSAKINPAASQCGGRSLALESLQHQIRSLGQQYSSATPTQRIITLEKGVALDYDCVARDNKAQSKELYTWGQHEEPDLTDVTDRLAYLNFLQGALSASLSAQLDSARSSLKPLRDAEAAILPKRNIRSGLRNQIKRIEHNPEKGAERRLAELKEQLSRAESQDEQVEKELELLKRKAIRESEQAKWEAIQEYGEKLVLLTQAAKPIIGALPTLPPTTANPYAGAEVTAAARASLQHALDNYKLGQTNLEIPSGADLSRSDTRSFGESHASELSAGHDSHPGLPVTPPIPEPPASTQAPADPNQSASPTPVQPVSVVVQGTSVRASESPAVASSEDLYSTSPVKTESAAEEKQRLEREERERVQAASNERSSVPGSAEEEKRRLEREERERVLAGGANPTGNTAGQDGEDLPPYKEVPE